MNGRPAATRILTRPRSHIRQLKVNAASSSAAGSGCASRRAARSSASAFSIRRCAIDRSSPSRRASPRRPHRPCQRSARSTRGLANAKTRNSSWPVANARPAPASAGSTAASTGSAPARSRRGGSGTTIGPGSMSVWRRGARFTIAAPSAPGWAAAAGSRTVLMASVESPTRRCRPASSAVPPTGTGSPSTVVPFVDARSRTRMSDRPTVMLACRRDTCGSSSATWHSGDRPIVVSPGPSAMIWPAFGPPTTCSLIAAPATRSGRPARPAVTNPPRRNPSELRIASDGRRREFAQSPCAAAGSRVVSRAATSPTGVEGAAVIATSHSSPCSPRTVSSSRMGTASRPVGRSGAGFRICGRTLSRWTTRCRRRRPACCWPGSTRSRWHRSPAPAGPRFHGDHRPSFRRCPARIRR